MKLLGHAWVAVNSCPKGNTNQLILGSITPEIMFYTSNHPFTLDEIHEGGNEVYNWCVKNTTNMVDFAIGMIAHSSKYGADRFNKDDKLAILGYKGFEKEYLRSVIQNTMNVSSERSKILAHNLLELAIELSLIEKQKRFVEQFIKALDDTETINSAVKLLSEVFSKNPKQVLTSNNELLDKAKSCKFQNAYDLSLLWRKMEPRDPEFKINDLASLLIEMNKSFNGRERNFINECIMWTKSNLTKIITS